MKIKFSLIILFCLFNFISNGRVWNWTHPEPNGSAPVESDIGHHSATDAQGNLYVLGDYNDSLFLNNVFRTQGIGSFLIANTG